MSDDPQADRAPNLARYCDAGWGERRTLPLDVLINAAREASAEGVPLLGLPILRDLEAGYPEVLDDPERYGLTRNE